MLHKIPTPYLLYIYNILYNINDKIIHLLTNLMIKCIVK